MLHKVKAYIEKHHMLSPQSDVIVGFSGGGDSTALVFLLHTLGYRVTAVHIEHGIRGKEALDDAAFAMDFCQKYAIPCFVEHLNIPAFAKERKLSVEAAARQERYRILQTYAKKLHAPIAVAHHETDQAETVLLHLTRGSGLTGLCGMQPVSGNIIRPLLAVSKEEINTFLQENNLAFCTDSTNTDIAFSRNRLRLCLLPELEAINPNSVSAIASCAELLTLYKEWFDASLQPFIQERILEEKDGLSLNLEGNLPYILQLELIKTVITRMQGPADIERIHLENAAALWQKQPGRQVSLPGGITAQRSYHSIRFFFQSEVFKAEFDFCVQQTYPWYGETYISSCFVPCMEERVQCEFLDFDALPPGLTLRTRRSGDFIHPLGIQGKCSLKKYFIDKKIPRQERDKIPLLAKESEVFAILGRTVSSRAAVKETTKNIIKIFKEK